MDDINRFGPELALLAAGGLIVIIDALLPAAGRRARRDKRALAVALSLVGVAGSICWSVVLIAADERGRAFEGMMVVDDFSLFFNFLFAGVAAMIVLGSVDF